MMRYVGNIVFSLTIPGFHAPGEVYKVGKMKALLKPLNGYLASNSFLAIKDYNFVSANLLSIFKNTTEWKIGTTYVEFLMLPTFTHIDQLQIIVIVQL